MARDKPGLVYLINSSLLSAGPHRTGSGTSGATALPPPKGPRCTAPRGRASQEGSFSFRVGPAGLESQPDQIRSTCRPGKGCRGERTHAHIHAPTQTFTHPLTHSAYTRTPPTPPNTHNTTQQFTATSLPARSLSGEGAEVRTLFYSPRPRRLLGGTTKHRPSPSVHFAALAWFGEEPRALVEFSSVAQSCLTPWTAARQTSLSTTNSQSLLKLMSIESVMPSNYLVLCCPLLL